MDELSIIGKTKISEVKDGKVIDYYLSPEDAGLSVAPENEIKGGTVEENVKITLDILNGEKSARRDIVVLNAGAAIYTTGIADTIEEGVRLAEEAIDSGKALQKLNQLREHSFGNRKVISFYNALKDYEKISIIAEVKKASPSKGLIRPDLNHIAVAEAYLNSDVQAMSVLTETDFFLGRPEFISDIRKISNIPLLRKDFIIDEYQIYEAYMLGADAVLLIAAILDDTTLKEFMSIAESLGLDCLTEVHDIEEMKRVNNLGAKIVGINNRNLKTFEEDLHTTERLTAGLENRSEKAVVSESGIKNNTDLRYLETLGIDAVLIGESFMRRQDIAGAVSSMRGL